MKKKYVSILLILVGLAIISVAIFMRYDGFMKKKEIIDVFEKSLKNSGDNNSPNISNNKEKKDFQDAIGIIEIPKISLKVAIGEGVDGKNLNYTVGHFKDTPYPGEKGNSCIAGHRSYTYNEYFNRLDELREDDKIIIKTQRGEFTYIVYKKYVVLPEEVSVLNETTDAELTLITCTPIRVATHRLIIKAKLK